DIISGRDLLAVIAVAAIRVILQVCLLSMGFFALSVDDYLRVSVADQMAHHWAFFPDPLFLPGYFWIYSVPIRLGFAPTPSALAMTFLFSSATSVLLFLTFRQIKLSRSRAMIISLAITTQPISLWVGGVPLAESLGLFLLLFGIL